jgi:glutamine synthetase adenylyltransferase
MTQAGVLMHVAKHDACIEHTATLELIKELVRVAWYGVEEAEKLASAYRYFRKMKNWQNLECESDLNEVSLHRDNVIAVWERLMPAAGIEKS